MSLTDAEKIQMIIDTQKTFGTPEGQRVFEYIMDICHWGERNMIVVGSPELGTLRDGRRSVAYDLLALRHAPLSEGEAKPTDQVTKKEQHNAG